MKVGQFVPRSCGRRLHWGYHDVNIQNELFDYGVIDFLTLNHRVSNAS